MGSFWLTMFSASYYAVIWMGASKLFDDLFPAWAASVVGCFMALSLLKPFRNLRASNVSVLGLAACAAIFTISGAYFYFLVSVFLVWLDDTNRRATD